MPTRFAEGVRRAREKLALEIRERRLRMEEGWSADDPVLGSGVGPTRDGG